MAQIKVLKISSDGISLEHTGTADDITMSSFTANGGGVLSGTGLDMNSDPISDSGNLSFNDPSVNTIAFTSGSCVIDDLMCESKENIMDVGAAVLFPVITDVVGSVDALRLPALAGAPTASPADGGEGYLVWDSTNDLIYAWDGAAWINTSIATEAGQICNSYTADEALLINDVVYISAADNVSKADVSGAGAASRVLGFAQAAAADTNSVVICSEGVHSGFTGLTAGSRYFANPASAGLITTTTPVGTGNTVVQVGYAKSATQLHIHIEQLGRRS